MIWFFQDLVSKLEELSLACVCVGVSLQEIGFGFVELSVEEKRYVLWWWW